MKQLNAAIADLALPQRMRHLPVSPTGFPVPWFVAKVDGEYDFRVVDTPKVGRAIRQNLCWLCGQTIGRHLAFVIGPMCAVNRISSEPPSHRECAEYAVRACPFLTKPRMRRNDKDLPTAGIVLPAGETIARNPGVSLIWMTKSYRTFAAERGHRGMLIAIGPPTDVAFFAEGRTATRAEILQSIDSGMPILRHEADREGRIALAALEQQYLAAVQMLPAT